MVNSNIPTFLTKSDLGKVAEAVEPLARQVGGLDNAMDVADTIAKFMERVVPLFKDAANTFMELRNYEAGRANPETVADEVLYLDNPNPPGRTFHPPATDPVHAPEPGPPAHREPVPAPTVDREPVPAPTVDPNAITPIKVYGTALGYLNKLRGMDPDMTVTKILELSREHKAEVMAGIAQELATMRSTP